MKSAAILFFSLCFSTISFALHQTMLQKDTVQALVVTTNEENSDMKFDSLSGEQIIELIDSLLNLDQVPHELVTQLNTYIEAKAMSKPVEVTLTGFNDPSMYPSNDAYQSWDEAKLFPYKESLRANDKEVKLVLSDSVNYCHYITPYKGLITSQFGWRKGKPHKGLDIDLQVGDSVVSSFDGMVRVARTHNGYGRVVIVRHYNGLETLYAHLHRIKVKPGDIVEAGQLIGLGGSSGRSTGSHLHFEVRYKGIALNPKSIIDFNKNSLINDSIRLIKTKYSYAAVPEGVMFYTVQRGDNLFEIAKRYGTSIGLICELNGIRRNGILKVGQKLRIAG